MVKLAALLSVLGAASTGLAEVIKQDVRKNMGDDRVLNINFEDITDNVRNLLVQHDADQFGSDESGVSVKLVPGAVAALKESGVNFKDTTEEWISHFENNFANPELFCNDGVEACAGREMDDFYTQYQDLDAIFARIDSVAGPSPVATVGSIGTSHEGRNLKLIEIGDQSKPLAFFMCNIHAREWLTPMYCAYMIEKLVEGGGHRLLDTFSFAIVPSGNPDGYTYSRTVNSFWRKTRKPNSGSSCIGTDPNRNYNDNHCGPGASSNPCSDTFCGRAPFDQPETAALNNYAARANVRDRLITWTDFHSFGSYWLSPLGYTTAFPPAADYNKMERCMIAARDAVRAETGRVFTIGPAGATLGVAAGASDDYFYSAYDIIYSFTVEMRGNSFQPNPSNIDPSNREIFAGMVGQMDCIKDIELSGPSPGPSPTPNPVSGPSPTPAPVASPVAAPVAAPTCFFFFC